MPVLLRSALPVTLVALLVAGPACVPSEMAREKESPEEQPEEVDLAQYEDFDPAPYREEAPSTGEEEGVEHDVPERLLSGRAAEGVEQTVQGFRVQLLSSKDQSAAETAATEAKQWWRENRGDAPEGAFAVGEELPIYTVYRQPYYRVRVGNFTSRAAAERALAFLQQRYGDAFIAPSEVTVTR
jgi:septal ring-binding cell division protein DamX